MTINVDPRALDFGWHDNPSWLSVVGAVMRRLFPYVVEATLIPTGAYYVCLLTVGHGWGILAAATCTGLSVVRRLVRREQVPTLLLLAVVGISVRVGIYLLNESSFVYFIQPIIRTVATACFFSVSIMVGRPLVGRFAGDFCAFGSDVGDRPAIVSLFRRLTFLWAGAQFTIAAVNLVLLLTVPVAVFVGTAAATAWLVMGVGVVLTVVDAVRTTHVDGLGTALATGGRLHAFVHATP